ncbi:hypothetical protein D9756_002667 [Leucocoprinus leucothites]|uniref:2'-phosphotransferase n=1 Tax=Leucocoprinus leucothites TaxID=201217 RepID=A0A8H5GCQ1_9AGAR|nr:hypothetical protein D9756_002667 [Leucoagaricus leucothites]
MNAIKFLPKPSTSPSNFTRTLNIYKKTFRDPSQEFRPKTLGWEERPIRVANTVTWLLEHAKNQGLRARKDGYVRVQDLLQHPRLLNIDFPTIEKTVNDWRTHQLKLIYAPQNTFHWTDNEPQLCCWWIGLQKIRTHEHHVDCRVADPNETAGLVYQTSSTEWRKIRERGIPRGNESQITFHNDITIPFHYQGDNTFIRLNSNKLHSNIPLYTTRATHRRRGNKIVETFSTPAPTVPPTMFEAAMRIAVERFPLILRPEGGKGRRKPRQQEKTADKPRIMESGIDALRKYGFAHVVQSSGLEASLREQQKEDSTELTEKATLHRKSTKDGPIDVHKGSITARSIPSPPDQDFPKQSTKDPPSPSSALPTVPPHPVTHTPTSPS